MEYETYFSPEDQVPVPGRPGSVGPRPAGAAGLLLLDQPPELHCAPYDILARFGSETSSGIPPPAVTRSCPPR